MDPIADMLTKIRNASLRGHEYVDVAFSNMKYSIAKILKDEGYVRGVKTFVDEKKRRFIKIYMAYNEEGKSVISELKKISKPGRRVYVKVKDVKALKRNPLAVMVLSTPKGIMTDREALEKNVGGEAILLVW
jgi:small subunit ribosomal protein S8